MQARGIHRTNRLFSMTGLLTLAMAALVPAAAQAQSGYFSGRIFGGPVSGGYFSAPRYGGANQMAYIGSYYNRAGYTTYSMAVDPARFNAASLTDPNAALAQAQEGAAAAGLSPSEAELRRESASRLAQGQPIPRTNDTIDAQIEKDGKLLVKWQGEPRAVARIRFAVLDKDKKPLKEAVITRLPAQARFNLTNKTAYYQARVEYINGTATTVISPL